MQLKQDTYIINRTDWNRKITKYLTIFERLIKSINNIFRSNLSKSITENN